MDYPKEIKKLKEEKDALILVHNYQLPEVQEIADVLGDSLELAKKASETDKELIVFCGVKFMAETAKILSPQKTVLLPVEDADCPMANMVDYDDLQRLKQQHPEAKVVTYVNSTAAVKSISDICCTSANATQIVQKVDAEEIIFTPDKNLANFCQRFTSKQIIAWEGYCYVHERFSEAEVKKAKSNHPDATLLVHPECPPKVVDLADEVLSTSGMLSYAKESSNKKFIICTEEGLIYRLNRENPDKRFYSAGSLKICSNMKKTRIKDVFNALKNNQFEIDLTDEIISKSQNSLKEMLKYL